MINKVEICGVNTSKLPVLKEKELRQLLISTKEGNAEAREQVIIGNLRLVLSVIKKFTNRSENADDLFQIGCMGLIKSIDNFDLGHNVKFSTYAVPMIIGELRRYLRDNNSIRVSRSLKDISYKALLARDKLLLENNEEPTLTQIAKELNLPIEEVTSALNAIQQPVSIFEPMNHASNDGDDILIMDRVIDKVNSDESWLQNISIKEGIKKLKEMERLVLTLRYFHGRTQTEVSEEIGFSQAHVSRLEKDALLHLRKYV